MPTRNGRQLLGKLAAASLLLGTVLWGCGAPGETPADPEAAATTALAQPMESRPATQSDLLEDRSLSNVPETASCLQLKEGCRAGAYTCAVRCCDDWLYKFYPIACDGSCTTLANYYCGGHGGPKRIRWE
jgi:hypothetical protein